MQRLLVLAAAAVLSATSAAAAPPSVNVTVGPELQRKAVKDYGVRELDRLTASLRREVERTLSRSGRYPDARIELTLVDARPNRPTFQQMGATPGLSMSSFGVGGARIEGRVVAADGAVTPLSYSWYETDIEQAVGVWTWHDAEWTFGRFARRLAQGQELASR